jgi:hypothetical protein
MFHVERLPMLRSRDAGADTGSDVLVQDQDFCDRVVVLGTSGSRGAVWQAISVSEPP